MPDIDVITREIDKAKSGLNIAGRAAREQGRGKVARVDHTPAMTTGLIADVTTGIQQAKDAIAEVEAEMGR